MTYLGLRKAKQMIKKNYQYKLRTFINASHAIRWADVSLHQLKQL